MMFFIFATLSALSVASVFFEVFIHLQGNALALTLNISVWFIIILLFLSCFHVLTKLYFWRVKCMGKRLPTLPRLVDGLFVI